MGEAVIPDLFYLLLLLFWSLGLQTAQTCVSTALQATAWWLQKESHSSGLYYTSAEPLILDLPVERHLVLYQDLFLDFIQYSVQVDKICYSSSLQFEFMQMNYKNEDNKIISLKNFLYFDVVCTEATVQFEVVSVIEKGASEGKQQFLKSTQSKY